MSYGGLPPPITSTPLPPEEKKKPRQRKSKKDQQQSADSILNDSAVPLDSSLDATLVEGETPTKPAKKKRQSKKAKQAEEVIDDFDDKTQSTMEEDSYLLLPKKPKAPKRPRKAKADTSAAAFGDDASNATTELNGDTTAGDSLLHENSADELKPKKPKMKKVSPKKKLPKLALKFKANKKKRRGYGSPDNSDIEKTPPPSPADGEDTSDKRRSARNTKRQRYNDDIDIDLSEDDLKENEQQQVVNNVTLTEDTMVVEKIMTTRMAKREIEPDDEDEEEPKDTKVLNGEEGETKEGGDEAKEKIKKVPEPQFIEVEEFYVKYKNLSYLHCDWKTEEELEKGDRRVSGKIKRYRQKKDVNMFDFLDDEPFNPDYVEVDRVLDVNEVEEVYEEEEEGEEEEEKVDLKKEEVIKEEPKDETSTKSEEPSKVEENDKTDTEEEKPPPEESKTAEAAAAAVEAPVVKKTKKMVQKTRTSRHFLVKWRGLSYEEATWELEDDIDPVKIVNFYKFRDPPTSSDRSKIKKRPRPTEWRKMAASPVYKNGNTLREYQLEGLNWLNFCWHNG